LHNSSTIDTKMLPKKEFQETVTNVVNSMNKRLQKESKNK